MDIKSVKEKIAKGQWKNEIPIELREKPKPPKKKILKNPFKRKKA